jgi:galactonate dehydratase
VGQLARYLVGCDADHIRHFTHWAYRDFAGKRGAMDFWSAVSGIEQALSDLAGKRLGVPVVSLLGGPCRERIRVYANGWYSGARTPDAYAAKAKETVARGFTALKFDPFPGPWRTSRARPRSRLSRRSAPCGRR